MLFAELPIKLKFPTFITEQTRLMMVLFSLPMQILSDRLFVFNTIAEIIMQMN